MLTVTAWVTFEGACLGKVGPFEVEGPWWAEVAAANAHVSEVLGVPVFVLRLVGADGGEGARDGHVTYHVEALGRPRVLLPGGDPGGLLEPAVNRAAWATAEGIVAVLGWADELLAELGRPRNGPVHQHRTWNLAGLFRIPTTGGPVWLKTLPDFAASEVAAITALTRADATLAPVVLGSAEGRLLLEHIPGGSCWGAPPDVIRDAVGRMARAQLALAGQLPPGVRDRTAEVVAAEVRVLVHSGAVDELGPAGLDAVLRLADRMPEFADCGMPDTLVHGDFHPGNWIAGNGSTVVIDWADSHFGQPMVDGGRPRGFLDDRAAGIAREIWIETWSELVPRSDPRRALELGSVLDELVYAVRYQEFLDGIESSERIYHEGDPVGCLRQALYISPASL